MKNYFSIGGICFLFLITCWFWTACDDNTLFIAKPESLNHYTSLFSEGDRVNYTLEEYMETPDSSQSLKITTKTVSFLLNGSQISDGDTLMDITMKIFPENSDSPEFENNFTAHFTESSITYTPVTRQNGPRVFLFKTSEPTNTNEFYLALPALLLKSEASTRTLGSFSFSRSITRLDTISYKNNREESWVVEETVKYNSQTVMTGLYWYGHSGLLKSRQHWQNLDVRDKQGQHFSLFNIIRECKLK
ncbi:MAG: hypothetical protein HQK83_18655 [Fibrobacteria bacterium]|nr:hypothetical protein [Fibrobacteria bacterium]